MQHSTATAKAYSLNITAVPHGGLGYLTTWPTGQAQPVVSTLNSSTGAVTANAAIVPAGTGGEISIFVSDTADVILDVNGYFALPPLQQEGCRSTPSLPAARSTRATALEPSMERSPCPFTAAAACRPPLHRPMS